MTLFSRSGWPPVIRLLLVRSPSHVADSVMPFIVDAINGKVSAWSPTNILQKLFKAIAPCFANLDPSASIVRIRRIAFVIAARFNASPNPIFGGWFSSAGIPMGKGASGGQFSIEASAALRAASSYMGSALNRSLAAIAEHFIHRKFGPSGREIVRSPSKNDQPSESLPYVVRSFHNCTFYPERGLCA